jgi:predicted amidophosphoribosyltransferase
MRLFGRKENTEEREERCPRCREHVPEGARECRMCGLALSPVRGRTSQEASPPSG